MAQQTGQQSNGTSKRGFASMDQEKRRLAQIQIDPENLPAAIEMFDIFMSEKVEPRRDFIVAHAKEVTDVDWHG